MLKRSHRLSARDLEAVIKSGRPVHSALFHVRVAESADGSARIAAVAPAKVAKTAVTRNRMKRRIYEAVQAMSPSAFKAAHVVIMAKQPALQSERAEIEADLKALFCESAPFALVLAIHSCTTNISFARFITAW